MTLTNPQRLTALLHPSEQKMVIEDIAVFNDTTRMYTLKAVDRQVPAYFEAGCYIPVFVEIDGNTVERPYSICSSPGDSENGIYQIVVKAGAGGYVSTHIINNWKKGDAVTLGSPKVAEVYSPIRDRKHLIALGGGVGITPFRSMAKTISEGDLDCDLTIFYGANTYDELLFKDEWKAYEEATNGRVKLIPVIANEAVEGCERGFITLDIISKYTEIEDASVFISGPPAMVAAMKKLLAPLQLPRKAIRVSMNGDAGFNHCKREEREFKLTVRMGGNSYETVAKGNETVLVAMEKAGLKPAVYCRSGICGFCRSMLVSGEIELATDENGLRKKDKVFGFIHPCCSYPCSDLELVVPRAK